MSGIWQNNIGLSIFGESHGRGIGITITGLVSGLEMDFDFIQSELNRRRPGQNDLTTPRKEDDTFEILSGVFNNRTTGAPLTAFIRNTNTRSRDYSDIEKCPRPGHADYPSYIKYKGFSDYRGGGHFSGRLTAGIVFAGAVAKLFLRKKNIAIRSCITQISNVKAPYKELMDEKEFEGLLDMKLPSFGDSKLMEKAIIEAKEAKDSVGGKIRCLAFGVKAGIGDPYFNSVESIVSHLMFSVPAIKGINFGHEAIEEKMGSEANDAYYHEGVIKTRTNHNGGILGGITNGMPIDFTVSVKATPSIGQPQETINYNSLEKEMLTIGGRHDPCIVPRVLPVIESILALTLLDLGA